MTPVSFFTPIHYGPAAKSWGHTFVEKVDDYFFLRGRKAVVLVGFPKTNNSQPTLYQKNFPSFGTVLKVISYCTVIIPLIVLVAKVCLRYMYRFHEFRGHPNVTSFKDRLFSSEFSPANKGAEKIDASSQGGSPALFSLQLRRLYKMSAEEIIPYKIRMTKDLYSIGERESVSIGYSDLPEYEGSYFLVRVCSSGREGCRYLVKRLKKIHQEVLCETRIPLTPEALESLQIDWKNVVRNEELGLTIGKSLREGCKGVTYSWSEKLGYISCLPQETL